jgi:signal transduction histidine kinase
MVDDFLNVGRPSKLKKTKFTLHDLFEQVQILVKQHMMAKSIRFNVTGEPGEEIVADLEQMRLVILNLLLNAIQAVPVRGAISINVKRDDSLCNLIVTIRDTGPGIPEENLDRIFEPYFTNRPGGTGLGLALARRIIEEHEGTIKATNHPKGGAQFEISLPIEVFIEV